MPAVEVDTTGVGPVHWTAVGLALVTGAVALLLAGLGYLGAVALVLVGGRRRALYAAGVPYTVVQLGLWYWLNYGATGRALSSVGAVEVVDKVAQAGLVVALVYLALYEVDEGER